MSRSVVLRWFPFLLLAALAACTPELKPHPRVAPRPAAAPTKPAPPSPATQPVLPAAVPWTGPATLIVGVSTGVSAERLATALESASTLRLTLVFPPNYFKDTHAQPTTPRFAALQQAGRVEVALSLDNEPVLPLLANIKRIPETQRGRVTFAWPDDIGHQMARGSAAYQRQWLQLPSGFYPPYQAVSPEVMDAARKFRLNWVMGPALAVGGVRFYGTTALLVPVDAPALGADTGTPAGVDKLITWATTQPFAFVDFSSATDGAAPALFFERLAATAAKNPQKIWNTAVVFVSELKDEHALPSNVDPLARDYSAWTAFPEQRRAWNALNEARTSIERYKNSGRANLQRLDAAMEEMSVAESGDFLLALGGEAADETAERNFVATVSNVHRLTENPVPPYLSNLFSEHSLQKAVPVRGTDLDRPFFVPGDHLLAWNDPAGDDNGAGKFLYPVGRYARGQFDLKEFSMAWTDTEVTFSITCGAATPTPPTTVLPLADIYVDINRLSGAGATAILPRRGDGYVEREAAWEYALAVSPAGAGLYQSTGGNASRLLFVLPVTRSGTAFQVVVPRATMRGEPDSWRLSVGVGGTDVRRPGEEPVPVPVLPTAGDRHFGGATPGRPVVTYLDFLAATVDEQTQRIGAYESGQRVTLPYVEGEAP